jgi:hypothetical protein
VSDQVTRKTPKTTDEAGRDQFGRPLVIDGTFPRGRLSCQSAFQLALGASDAHEFFAALDDEAKLWGGPWADELSRMSPDLRTLRLSDLLPTSVTYPASFAEDQAIADYGAELERWLRVHGASRAAAYVAELLALYPDSTPMSDPDERANHLSEFEAQHPDAFQEIGGRYLDIADDLVGPLKTLLREHGDEMARTGEALRAECAPPARRTLAEIMTVTDDVEFTGDLVEWLDAPGDGPKLGFDRQPKVGRMLWVLAALVISTEADGMTHFLNSAGIGQYFPKLQAWCKLIDAPATLAYVKRATAQLKRLNGGRLPQMGDAVRLRTIRVLEANDEASGGTGLFEVQDAEYRDVVMEELPRRIRAFVTMNRAAVEGEILEHAATFG